MDMHHVVVTRSNQPTEPDRPAQIAARPTDAVRANTGSLEFTDEMVFPRKDIDTLGGHIVAVPRGRRDEQPLRSTGAQTLHDPQHSHWGQC
jgi:hypothetical protein